MNAETDAPYRALERRAREAGIEGEDWVRFVENTRVRSIPKGALLVSAGEPVNDAWFCSEGLFRLFYPLPDGREYNVAFSTENDYVTSYGAMATGEPSAFSIEALEASTVVEIGRGVLRELMDRSHGWERFVRLAVERLYIRKEERERQLLYLPALERYEAFLRKYPGLDRRIPQYHIASYIGVSPVSLSRLLRSRRGR
ncbi:Crp/Fnr family transcriptional regulator [Cohnella xylanilytica]|uniref:Crp/Fnr family transcriptional regulator n=1 Tax=Cohnella xylanilytica TaxID=557555 RepID=A0A841U2Z4_9BACL|nr:Crp/Fnr family transcriptional regulator [Cohnella xylanilytica]MBB6694926.1 Crp/Fnr family transcriptional regulator [Cohnella xylanilytica]